MGKVRVLQFKIKFYSYSLGSVRILKNILFNLLEMP